MGDAASIGFAIRRLSNRLRRKILEMTAPPERHDRMSETAGMVMGFICDRWEQEVYQRDVERVFCIRRSTASRFLIGLEEEGMLRRESTSQDARRKRLIPTEKALAVHAELVKKKDSLESLMRQGLSEEELETFLRVAKKIEQNLA